MIKMLTVEKLFYGKMSMIEVYIKINLILNGKKCKKPEIST